MLLEKWIMIQLFFAKIFSCDCIYLPNHNDCPYKLFLVVVVVLIIINCFVLQCFVVLLTNNSVVLDLEFSHLFISIAKYLQDIAFPVMLMWNVTDFWGLKFNFLPSEILWRTWSIIRMKIFLRVKLWKARRCSFIVWPVHWLMFFFLPIML